MFFAQVSLMASSSALRFSLLFLCSCLSASAIDNSAVNPSSDQSPIKSDHKLLQVIRELSMDNGTQFSMHDFMQRGNIPGIEDLPVVSQWYSMSQCQSDEGERLIWSTLMPQLDQVPGPWSVTKRGIQRSILRTFYLDKAAFYQFLRLPPNEMARNIGQRSKTLLQTAWLLRNKRSIPEVDVDILQFSPNQCFPQPLPCVLTQRYRTISGWCNNVDQPFLGNPHRTLRRLLPPAYDDGFNEPRQTAVSGFPLPGPRIVSLTVHSTISREHPLHTVLLMQWGQFVDHDLTLTPMTSAEGDNGPTLNCNDCNSRQTVSQDCLPIPIPANSQVFGPSLIPICIPFIRSKAAPLPSGPRNQINQLTNFIDFSQLYGSNECRSSQTRAHQRSGGKLDVQISQEGEILPSAETEGTGCRSSRIHACLFGVAVASVRHCLFELSLLETSTSSDNSLTGAHWWIDGPQRAATRSWSKFWLCVVFCRDSRINEHVGIAELHVVFVREHNLITDHLAAVNPTWDDETLFQEARRIAIALFQHITYKEFLPRVVGQSAMTQFGLGLRASGFYDGYDSTCDPTIANEFATAAFRFGHSLIPSAFPLTNQAYQPLQSIPLVETFFNPGLVYRRHFSDQCVMGMISSPMQGFDRFASPMVRDQLFALPDQPNTGLDLFSINIQRGRDHGLQPYTHYRQLFHLAVPSQFSDLLQWMNNDTVAALASVYESVHDIDLFTGLTSERPLEGAVVGPTAANIIAEQFQRLRKCDRFWYENANQAGSFTESQLAEIRRQTLAHVLCRNLRAIETVQPHVFDLPDHQQNGRVPCSSLPSWDLSPWAE